MERYAIKQGSTITTTKVHPYKRVHKRTQEVLTIFPSKQKALAWRNTWLNKEDLKLVKVEIQILD